MKKFFLGFLIIIVILSVIFLSCFSYKKNQEDVKTIKTVKKVKKKYTGIFKDNMGKAQKLRKKMSLDEKVGQVFLVRYEEQGIYNVTKDYYPSGYLLFSKDFKEEDKENIKTKFININKYSKIPLIYAVDEEGGIVNRVSKFSQFRESPFPSIRDLYLEGGIDKIKEVEKEKADLLLSLGINLNLEPVADISVSPDDFIYLRSLGQNVDITSNTIKEIVSVMNSKKMSGCLKHFPGYGNNIDTHTDIAIDEREYKDFVESDFKPFEAGIKEGAPMVLVSHNIVNSMDPSFPASLSKKVHDILRNDLNFSGVIITDDLSMGAIKKYTNDVSPVVVAINAGNDLLITSSFESDFQLVKEEAIKNKDFEKILNSAVDRILAWKYTYDILK